MCFLSHAYRSKTNAGTLAQHNASVIGKPGLLLLGQPTGITVLVLNQISLYIQAVLYLQHCVAVSVAQYRHLPIHES